MKRIRQTNRYRRSGFTLIEMLVAAAVAAFITAAAATMTGSRKSAYISGQLLHEGDEIAGFSVVRIEAGRVVLTKYGIQRTLSVP